MPLTITWLGHATWTVATDKHTLLIDPFLDDNPAASVKSSSMPATSPSSIRRTTRGRHDGRASKAKR